MIYDSNDLKRYLRELSSKKVEYRPGVFWLNAIEEITKSFALKGLSGFREDKTNLNFFVPTYGYPGNGFSQKEIDILIHSLGSDLGLKKLEYIRKTFDGSLHALADFRTFQASSVDSNHLDFSKFSESTTGSPKEHFKFEGNAYSRSSLNYLLGLSFLRKIYPDFLPKTILEIGGGFGTLAEIFGKCCSYKFRYIGVDLPPMFIIADSYLRACFKDNGLFFDYKSNEENKRIHIEDLCRFSFLPNWRIEDLEGEIDLFVNFISFQEMEPVIVKNYVEKIQKLKPRLILLRNLREGKQKSKKGSLGVEEPIKSKEYINYFEKYRFVASNISPFGYRTIDGFNSELLILEKK